MRVKSKFKAHQVQWFIYELFVIVKIAQFLSYSFNCPFLFIHH